MIARGDLAVELSAAEVPALQKMLVRKANDAGKLSIVATQMLESMITTPRPPRAEASDVANAVLDGADAVMLSAETASGKHPTLVVETMARIVVEAESSPRARYVKLDFLAAQEAQDFQNAVSQAGVRSSHELGAEAIVVYSTSGNTARLVSDYRPRVPILALVPSIAEQRRLAFAWGVVADVIEPPKDSEDLFAAVDQRLEARQIAKPGDTVVVLFKQPLQSSQRTNTLLLHVVGAGRSRP